MLTVGCSPLVDLGGSPGDGGIDSDVDSGVLIDGGVVNGDADVPVDAGRSNQDAGPLSAANPMQIDFSAYFTVDTVANTALHGESYPPLTPMDDNGFDFLTNSAGAAGGDTTGGLPDNGQFAANGDHPFIQFAFNNTSTANNSVILQMPSKVTLTVPIPPTKFKAVQIYMTATGGETVGAWALNHDDGTSLTGSFSLPDWSDPGSVGGSMGVPAFVVASGLGRFHSAGVEHNDAFALYGISIQVPGSTGASDTVTSLSIAMQSNGPRFIIYGATGY